MRIFIILLLLANVLYAAVNYFVVEPNRKVGDRVQDSGNHSLALLSELEGGQLRELAGFTTPSTEQIENKQVVDCMKIVGEWDLATLTSVKQALSEHGITLVAEGKERMKKVNYWVVIPPFASRQEAITAKRQLNSESIVDTFIIKSGARENAVSLGLYSKEESAIRRAKFVNQKRLGIAAANIEELTLYVDRRWIKVGSDKTEKETIMRLMGPGVIDTKQERCEIRR